MVAALFLYLLNNYLVFWQNWPGPYIFFSHLGLPGLDPLDNSLSADQVRLGWIQVTAYLLLLAGASTYALMTKRRTLHHDARRFSILSAYIIRTAFWAVVLIGFADALISFLRVENFLGAWVSQDLVTQLGRPIFRGTYIHYPLILLSLVFAWFFRSISFSWLALMVVLSEFLIVITRFVFSYEQAYMGDLVRFWYAALFLFASAYTLVHEGHVRVDVIYANFSRRTKAWTNSIGILLLGLPICWVILMQGMGGKGNSINSALLSFEISQSGYGLYVKYLMAGFLVIFAVSMMIQFVSFLLHSIADIIHDYKPSEHPYNQICGY
ncbi:MAG: TRAP transporter small permease subunit [Gammaproteobacteria bacterium]|nr:TRAP transporter small permease subunit [Gammaproteobacteria bacterium]